MDARFEGLIAKEFPISRDPPEGGTSDYLSIGEGLSNVSNF